MTKLERYKSLLEHTQTLLGYGRDYYLEQTKIYLEKVICTEEVFASFSIENKSKGAYFCYGGYIKLGEYECLAEFGSGGGKDILNIDSQPKCEFLYNISFSTGAYIFGEDYDNLRAIFKDFIDEIKSLDPKYIDAINNNFYFSKENAAAAHKALPVLLKKYKDIARNSAKKWEVERLKKEIAKLEMET